MKDFPLNDLLSVTELDRMSPALSSIFTHLRKIRSTKYPVQRALRLVEAISRDLSNQVLKVDYISNLTYLKSYLNLIHFAIVIANRFSVRAV